MGVCIYVLRRVDQAEGMSCQDQYSTQVEWGTGTRQPTTDDIAIWVNVTSHLFSAAWTRYAGTSVNSATPTCPCVVDKHSRVSWSKIPAHTCVSMSVIWRHQRLWRRLANFLATAYYIEAFMWTGAQQIKINCWPSLFSRGRFFFSNSLFVYFFANLGPQTTSSYRSLYLFRRLVVESHLL